MPTSTHIILNFVKLIDVELVRAMIKYYIQFIIVALIFSCYLYKEIRSYWYQDKAYDKLLSINRLAAKGFPLTVPVLEEKPVIKEFPAPIPVTLLLF